MTNFTSPSAEPLIDVLLPAYNCAATISAAIESVLAQSVRNIRVIVVDDGSTDATGAVVQELAERDRRVILISKTNTGIVNTLNLALSMARAPYIARHDGDDISIPTRFERQLEAFRDDEKLVAVSGACTHIGTDGQGLGTRYEPWDPALASTRSIPSLEPYLLHPFLMVRRDAIVAVGGYRQALHAEDTDLYWRLRDKGRLINLPDVLGMMRIHNGSITNQSVINGRISAIHSQLAAISAARRTAGRVDIDFPKGALLSFQKANSLDEMLRLASEQLDGDEARYLRLATCAKLLELSTNRAYELELNDFRTIKAAYLTLPSADLRGPSIAGWGYRAVLKRLVQRGDLRSAWALASVSVLLRTAIMRFFPAAPAMRNA